MLPFHLTGSGRLSYWGVLESMSPGEITRQSRAPYQPCATSLQSSKKSPNKKLTLITGSFCVAGSSGTKNFGLKSTRKKSNQERTPTATSNQRMPWMVRTNWNSPQVKNKPGIHSEFENGGYPGHAPTEDL